jgi:hypothetical protein
VDVFLLAEAPAAGHPVALEGVQPSVTLTFDGSNSRASADFDDTTAVAMAVRWTPETTGAELNLRELNTFANISLADYEVASAPAAIAEAPSTETAQATQESRASDTEEKSTASTRRANSDGKEIMPIAEGKETVDFKGGSAKESKEIIGAGPASSGYFPGGLGFPPNLSGVRSGTPVILVPPGSVKPPTGKPLSP